MQDYFQAFGAYSLTNTFTQVSDAKISATSYDTAGSCSSTNSITFKCSKSSAPYTVQLYRFGVAYGSPVVTNKNAAFSNLPDGSYYATAYGDGATGSAFGASKTIDIIPLPSNPNTINIKATQVKLNWTTIACADYYLIQYRVHGTTTWTNKQTTGNVSAYTLKNLSAATTYDWKVASVDSANGINTVSAYTNSTTFTTSSALVTGNNIQAGNVVTKEIGQIGSIMVSPNPATSYFTIHYNSNTKQKINSILYDVNGKALWSSGAISADALNGKQVIIRQFENGLYFLKILDEQGVILGSIKVLIAK